jgi:drug/metabolite transporter (DMT)-like permease
MLRRYLCRPVQHRFLPLFIVLVLGLVWGSSFILIFLGLKAFTPIQVASLRLMFAGFFMLPVVWLFRKEVDRNGLKFLFLSGLIGNGIPAILFATAGTMIPSGISGVLNSLTPLFTLLFGFWFFGVGIQKRHIWGVFFGLTGAAVLLLPGYFMKDEKIMNPLGGVLAIVATMLYGINVNIIKQRLSHLNPFVVSAYPLAFMAMCALPVFLWSNPGARFEQFGPQAWASLGYMAVLGIVGSALSLIIFNILVQRTTALFASANTFVIPVVSVAWGLVYQEPFGWNMVVGLLMCFVAIFLVMRR